MEKDIQYLGIGKIPETIQYMGTGRTKKNTEIRDILILVLSIIGFYLLGVFVVIPKFLD